jgi:sterol desaturase/sphingolipid hydroxylase (fatty acid hydroxylase superfamily)
MHFVKVLFEEIISFFGLDGIIEMVRAGDYSKLTQLDGILSAISPLIPLLLIIELTRTVLYKKFKVDDYRVPFFTILFNRTLGRFLSLGVVAFCIASLEKHAVFKTSFTWYWLIYGYIVWEFAHFIYHYLAHKVRLLWILHSTHHAPRAMNLSVTYAHFFLEAPYADLIRTSVCIMAGVSPPTLFFIMFIDGTWGSFIHVGENLLKDGRLGFLNKIILTPSHHRVHHAQNPLYMDTNFCNLLNIWDRVFGTFQFEKEEIPIQYGITRKMNPNNFLDAYFGEIPSLWNDVRRAPGIRNKLRYIFMPPGWSHDGPDRTAHRIRKEWVEKSPQLES